MKAVKPVKMPFENSTSQSTTNTFGYQSFDPENQYVKDYMNQDVEVDPGARQRTDLAEQSSRNRWNGTFAAGIPPAQRMMMQGAEGRQIQQQGAYEQQDAKYKQNALKLARAQSLLPQLTQTGGSMNGTSSGYQSAPGQNGFWNRLAGGFADSLGNSLGQI